MKRCIILTIIILILASIISFSDELDLNIEFNKEEISWLEENEGKSLKVGLDPYSGMDFFEFKGEKNGYIFDLASVIEEETGLIIEIVDNMSWQEAYDNFLLGEIDILFGANVTKERLEIMDFTAPIYKYPYAVFSTKNSGINTLGDLDNKRVGFIEGDIAIELLVDYYSQLNFEIVELADQIEGLEALEASKIDGLITSGGAVVYEFIYNYDNIDFLFDLDNITSDMTLSTIKGNETLNSILTKVINNNCDRINTSVSNAKVLYNRKILNLTDEELEWLERGEDVVVGVVDDYLPFDYYKDGKYYGIGASLISEISDMVGINLSYDYGDFDDVYKRALKGQVDIINIAKTEERDDLFIFTKPFSEERDRIYGDKNSSYIGDIYGLENKKIAIIRGFWHEEFLKKNLRNVEIIITDDIKESIELVDSGRADYFIENKTVAEYYISGLGYWNIIKKGETSKDSFLYFGINNNKEELASIIDKALFIIDYEILKQEGLENVPSLMSQRVVYLIWTVVFLLIIISIFIYIIVGVLKSLINEREEKAILKERENMMYHDPLTHIKNRLYYSHIESSLDELEFPQIFIVSDLNDLKKINDTHGHHVGDAYIKAYSNILLEACEDSIVCRMGGDEFLVIKAGCNQNCAKEIVDKIQSRCVTYNQIFSDVKISNINAAIGYSIRYSAEKSPEGASIEADNMMYENKKLTKNTKCK